MTTNMITIVDQRAASRVAVIPAYTPVQLSTDGKLHTSLFAWSGHDVRALMHSGNGAREEN